MNDLLMQELRLYMYYFLKWPSNYLYYKCCQSALSGLHAEIHVTFIHDQREVNKRPQSWKVVAGSLPHAGS